MSKCQHPPAMCTLCVDTFEGETFPIYQCDVCGLTLPLRETPDVGNVLELPPVDETAVEHRFFVLFKTLHRKEYA